MQPTLDFLSHSCRQISTVYGIHFWKLCLNFPAAKHNDIGKFYTTVSKDGIFEGEKRLPSWLPSSINYLLELLKLISYWSLWHFALGVQCILTSKSTHCCPIIKIDSAAASGLNWKRSKRLRKKERRFFRHFKWSTSGQNVIGCNNKYFMK